MIGQAALFEAHRKEASKKPSRPFNSRMDKTTFKQYTSAWNRLLSYVWRVDDLDEEDRPGFKITRAQQSAFDQVIDAVDTVVETRLPDRGSSGSGSGGPPAAEAKLQSAILEWVIKLLDHQLGDQ